MMNATMGSKSSDQYIELKSSYTMAVSGLSVYNVTRFMLAARQWVTFLGYENSYVSNIDIDVVMGIMKLRVDAQLKYDSVHRNTVLMNVDGSNSKLREMFDWLVDLPTADAYRRVQWKQRLVDLQTEGEELNMGFEYTEMLRKTAEKLASNALEDRS